MLCVNVYFYSQFKQQIEEEEENLLYRQVHPGRCFALEPESSDIVLECNGEKKVIMYFPRVAMFQYL